MRMRILACWLWAGLALAPAFGSGFALIEQGAAGQGNAFSGATVENADPSCAFFNPAGMSDLRATEISLGGSVIQPNFQFKNDGSRYLEPKLGGRTISGGNSGNGGNTAYVPNLYLTRRVAEPVTVGLAVNVPFGLVTQYDQDWVGRYFGIKSDLSTMNLSPSVAWRVTEFLSLGAGFDAMYVNADLTSAVDIGLLSASRGVPGAMPGKMDGFAEVKGNDWGYGYHLGAIAKPWKGGRLGLAFRSKVDTTIKGTVNYTGYARGILPDGDAQGGMTFPETLSGGVAQQLGQLTLMADVAWTRWSRFDELRFQFSSGQKDTVNVENWENTMRYALGANYALTPKWTLRAGTAYDQSPVSSASLRYPRIPDADRYWLSLGVGYAFNDSWSVDAGYTHLFFGSAKVDNMDLAIGQELTGAYDNAYVDILALQVTLKI